MKVNYKSIHFMDKSSMDKFRWRLRSLEYSLHTCINSRLSPLQCSVSLVLFSPPRPSLSIPLSLHFFLHPVSQDGPLVTSTDGFPAGCTGRQGSIHTVINTLFFFRKESVHENRSETAVPSGGCTVLRHKDCRNMSQGHVFWYRS